MTTSRLRIAIAGLGTVGGGLLSLVQRAGPRDPLAAVEIVAVSARNRTRKRGVDIQAYSWFDDPAEFATIDGLDVVVELIGGSDGPAKKCVEAALSRGVHVVTANKALLAEHGSELAELSERTGAQIFFEAAIGGGMPVVKALREGLVANRVQRIAGILNGTCNYLLTEMEAAGRQFAEVLSDAQRLGYAEADPTTDIGGFDAAHKIALLAAIGFGAPPDYASVSIKGVEDVGLVDLRLAGKLGYRIKLIASAERMGEDSVLVAVTPSLLPLEHPLARVDGPLNAVVIDAEPVGRMVLSGLGAGAGPTASAVASDLVDLAHGARRPAFGRPLAALAKPKPAPKSAIPARSHYVRVMVEDRPGVIAAISNELARAGVSIASFLQDPAPEGGLVPIVMTTQRCAQDALDAAVGEIARLSSVVEPPRVMPILGDGAARANWS